MQCFYHGIVLVKTFHTLKRERDRFMQMTIRGHHLSITPAIENTIREKFAQMTRHLDQVNSVQVKLSKDHQLDKLSRKGSGNHIAEAIIRLPKVELFAQASADDMYSSITQLMEKFKRQLQRHREIQAEAQSNFQLPEEDEMQLI